MLTLTLFVFRGGLLSAHFLAESHVNLSGYNNELLLLAKNVAERLLPAFDTPTGIPYGTVNLRYGVPPGETVITSLAGAGTFILEFAAISRQTKDERFEQAAKGALRALWASRSEFDLVGNHIDIWTGEWTHLDSGIGSNQDSFYEYLYKGI